VSIGGHSPVLTMGCRLEKKYAHFFTFSWPFRELACSKAQIDRILETLLKAKA
jgi:hypothetical protein